MIKMMTLFISLLFMICSGIVLCSDSKNILSITPWALSNIDEFRAWKLSDALHQLTHTQSQWDIYLCVYQQSMFTPERDKTNLVAIERISEVLCVKTEDEKTSLRMRCDFTGIIIRTPLILFHLKVFKSQE